MSKETHSVMKPTPVRMNKIGKLSFKNNWLSGYRFAQQPHNDNNDKMSGFTEREMMLVIK